MLAFRSLDPFRALREPDRRRRDEERLSRSEQRTLSKTQNNHLTGKAPYKFESPFLQRGVYCEPEFSGGHRINDRRVRGDKASAAQARDGRGVLPRRAPTGAGSNDTRPSDRLADVALQYGK